MRKGELFSTLILTFCAGIFFGMLHVQSVWDHKNDKPIAESYIVERVEVIEREEQPLETPLDPDIPEDVQIAARNYGDIYGICPEFLMAIAFYESSYRPEAVNGSCKGLMQINIDAQYERMDEMGVAEEDLYDPYTSMAVAADYLAELFGRYEDPAVVLMIYNGDRRVWELTERGEMSVYARNVLTLSAELEEKHGKVGDAYGCK